MPKSLMLHSQLILARHQQTVGCVDDSPSKTKLNGSVPSRCNEKESHGLSSHPQIVRRQETKSNEADSRPGDIATGIVDQARGIYYLFT